ncbi:hypothetical protein F511_01542 [Dorcoceras hygrometricum]|nr:hypothetical protein F511_01542 [Dorcoceras hygrometricum]
MPDQIVRMVNDTKETDCQFMQSHQSVWMSRWNRTRCSLTTQAHNGRANTVQKLDLDHTLRDDNCANKLKISRSVKRDEEIVTKSLAIVNESLRQDLPTVLPAISGSVCETEIQFPGVLASNDIVFKNCNYQDESTSKHPSKWIQSHASAEDSISAVSESFWESFVTPSSVASPFIFESQLSEFDEGKTPVPSFIGRSAIISSSQLIDANLRMGKHEHNHKVDNHSQPRNSVTVCSKERNSSSFCDPPSMSSHHMSTLGREWFQKMQKFSGLRLFPSQFDASEKTEVMKALYHRYSQQKLPKCMYDMETLYSTLDSVEDPGVSSHRFRQTTHTLLISNLENSLFRSTRISGDTPCDLCNMSPCYGKGKRGLKIQSPSNFTNSERKGNYAKDSEVTARNESYVEEKDPLSGAISTPLTKAIFMDCNSRQASVAFSIQGEVKIPNTELRDINLELRSLPASVTSSENWDSLSSRTQSLEMDIILTHTKQPKEQSVPCLDNSPVANPGNRCVKRRKLSSSHSTPQGTDSSSEDEPSLQGEPNKNFGTIFGSAVISSEPPLTQAKGKDQYFSVKDQEVLLSHAWIKRWQGSSTKNESRTVVFGVPRSSNLTLKGLQNEHFPSIAAMALMRRALSGFQPCELQKRGSLTVWYPRAL